MYSTFAGSSALLRMTIPVGLTLATDGELTLSCGTARGASTTGEAGTVDGQIYAARVGTLHIQ